MDREHVQHLIGEASYFLLILLQEMVDQEEDAVTVFFLSSILYIIYRLGGV
jgi:hypothetical protein